MNTLERPSPLDCHLDLQREHHHSARSFRVGFLEGQPSFRPEFVQFELVEAEAENMPLRHQRGLPRELAKSMGFWMKALNQALPKLEPKDLSLDIFREHPNLLQHRSKRWADSKLFLRLRILHLERDHLLSMLQKELLKLYLPLHQLVSLRSGDRPLHIGLSQEELCMNPRLQDGTMKAVECHLRHHRFDRDQQLDRDLQLC